jgi:hypothetical protein
VGGPAQQRSSRPNNRAAAGGPRPQLRPTHRPLPRGTHATPARTVGVARTPKLRLAPRTTPSSAPRTATTAAPPTRTATSSRRRHSGSRSGARNRLSAVSSGVEGGTTQALLKASRGCSSGARAPPARIDRDRPPASAARGGGGGAGGGAVVSAPRTLRWEVCCVLTMLARPSRSPPPPAPSPPPPPAKSLLATSPSRPPTTTTLGPPPAAEAVLRRSWPAAPLAPRRPPHRHASATARHDSRDDDPATRVTSSSSGTGGAGVPVCRRERGPPSGEWTKWDVRGVRARMGVGVEARAGWSQAPCVQRQWGKGRGARSSMPQAQSGFDTQRAGIDTRGVCTRPHREPFPLHSTHVSQRWQVRSSFPQSHARARKQARTRVYTKTINAPPKVGHAPPPAAAAGAADRPGPPRHQCLRLPLTPAASGALAQRPLGPRRSRAPGTAGPTTMDTHADTMRTHAHIHDHTGTAANAAQRQQ